MQIIVQDLATEYFRVGTGKTLVLLHGWGDDSRSWRVVAKQLAEHYDVIVPDLPGFGGTQPPPAAWNLTDYASFVRDMLQKLGVSPHAVVGHSNGGAIAVRMVGRGYVSADKLVLLASAGVRGTQSHRGLYMLTKVGKAVASPLPARVKKQLRRKLYARAGSDLLVAEHLQETFKRIVRDDVREDAAFISTPTLLVYGDHDTETPLKLGQQLQNAIEGAHLEVLSDKGHLLHIEAPTEVVKAVEDFVGA